VQKNENLQFDSINFYQLYFLIKSIELWLGFIY